MSGIGTIVRALLAVVAVVVANALTAAPAVGAGTCTPAPFSATSRPDLAAQVVELVNAYRGSKGLSPLATSAPLVAASGWKSMHMAAYGYFSHDDPAPPVARSAHQRALDCGYAGRWWGENIAAGYRTAQSVVDGWLGSPGHRANIENASFSSTGVGVAVDAGGRIYWTQGFGDDVAGPSQPPSASPAPAPPPASASGAATSPAPSPAAAPTSGGSSASPSTTSPPAPRGGVPEGRTSTAAAIAARSARVRPTRGNTKLVALVAFVDRSTGRAVVTGSVHCRAEVGGRRLRVVANAFRSGAAQCAWRVPSWARGKRVDGVVAVQRGTTAAIRVFARILG